MSILYLCIDSIKKIETMENKNELLEKEIATLSSEKDAFLLAEKIKQDQLNLVNNHKHMYTCMNE